MFAHNKNPKIDELATEELRRGATPEVVSDLGATSLVGFEGTDIPEADDSVEFEEHVAEALISYGNQLKNPSSTAQEWKEVLERATFDVETGLLTQAQLDSLTEIAESQEQNALYLQHLGSAQTVFEINRIFNDSVKPDHKAGLLSDEQFAGLESFRDARIKRINYDNGPDLSSVRLPYKD